MGPMSVDFWSGVLASIFVAGIIAIIWPGYRWLSTWLINVAVKRLPEEHQERP